MAALLEAYGKLHPSFTHCLDKQVLTAVEKEAKVMAGVARRLKERPELSILRGVGSEATEAMNEWQARRARRLLSQLKATKQPQALMQFMGPAENCYDLLFGEPATGGSDDASSPFTDFVVAFLGEVGCRYDWKSVKRALYMWRKHTSGRYSSEVAALEARPGCAPRVHEKFKKGGKVE